MGWINLFGLNPNKLSAKLATPKPGLYHTKVALVGGSSDVHLRLEEDLTGVMLVNASRMYHLNPSAAFLAYHFVQGVDPGSVLPVFRNQFGLSKLQAEHDFRAFKTDYDKMVNPNEFCPLCDMDFEISLPNSHAISAPYRMDLALTYRCNNDCLHCYNDRNRSIHELSADNWKRVLAKTWQLGIPHIVFTGGEPTIVPALPELITYAQNQGQIAGLNTNGRRLADVDYCNSLVDAGLDHVQITLESHLPDVHNAMVANPQAWQQTVAGLKNALNSRLYVMTNTTLLSPNMGDLAQFIDFVGDLGLRTIGLNALIYSGAGLNTTSGIPEEKLPELLAIAQEKTQAYGMRLIWYTPTQYCHFDPLAMGLGIKGCSAARYNMCVEPNGDVLPCQSYYTPLGNLLDDDWQTIWNHKLAVSLRERQDVPFACQTCELLNECGGGCPLARSAGKMSPPVPVSTPIPSEA